MKDFQRAYGTFKVISDKFAMQPTADSFHALFEVRILFLSVIYCDFNQYIYIDRSNFTYYCIENAYLIFIQGLPYAPDKNIVNSFLDSVRQLNIQLPIDTYRYVPYRFLFLRRFPCLY